MYSDGRMVIQEVYDSVGEDEDDNMTQGNPTRIAINILPNRFIGEIYEETGSPIYAVIAVTLFIALTNTYLGFDTLVEFNLFTYFVFFAIECASYLILKHMEPDTQRLFEIPFGKIGGWIVVTTLMIALGICFFIMIIDDATLFAIALGMNIGLIVYYFVSKQFCHRMHQDDILMGKGTHFHYLEDADELDLDDEDDGYHEIQPLI